MGKHPAGVAFAMSPSFGERSSRSFARGRVYARLKELGKARSVLLAVVFANALASSSCASIGEPAAWADGEVRELDSGRPIQGAIVFMSISAAGPVDSSSADRTNEAGHFAVFQAVDRGQRAILLVVEAAGFKPAELPLPILQSNSVIARLAALGSSKASRIEQMPAQSEDGDGMDGSSGSR